MAKQSIKLIQGALVSISDELLFGLFTKKHSTSPWSDDFIVKDMERLVETERSALTFGKEEWDSWTEEELLQIGFRRWDGSGLMLIPFYLFQFIPMGLKVTCINGDNLTVEHKRANLDWDIRFGCIAYGIYPAGNSRKLI